MSVLEPNVVARADQYIDENHGRFAELGGELFTVFGFDRKKGHIATQVRNLQQTVCSATRFADIEDFVKNQMGKAGNREWKRVGDRVVSQLAELRSASGKLTHDPAAAMAARLRLARGWVRAVVSEYLYQVAQAQIGAGR